MVRKEPQTHIRVYSKDKKKIENAMRRKKIKSFPEAIRGLIYNRKGLADGLLAIFFGLFVFALFALFIIKGWGVFDHTVQGLDNSTVRQETKDRISAIGSGVTYLPDKLLAFFFVALFVGYLTTSSTLPVDKGVFVLIFGVFLVLASIIAMMVSNSYAYLVSLDMFSAEALKLPFTTYLMRYLPYFTFFCGLAGAVIFYSRKKASVGGVAGFE